MEIRPVVSKRIERVLSPARAVAGFSNTPEGHASTVYHNVVLYEIAREGMISHIRSEFGILGEDRNSQGMVTGVHIGESCLNVRDRHDC